MLRNRSGRSLGMLLSVMLAAMVAMPGSRCAASEPVAQWDFSRENDLNFDNVPDGWKRVYGQRYPRYLTMEIQAHDPQQEAFLRACDARLMRWWRPLRSRYPGFPALPPSLADMGVDRYLAARVDGGGILAHSPSFAVGASYSYHFTVRMRCDGLERNQAWIDVEFLDAEGKVIHIVPGHRLRGTQDWTLLETGPVACPLGADRARLTLHFESETRPDMSGSIGVDAIRVERLPRIRLRGDSPLGLYERQAQPQIHCVVSGLASEVGALRFSLHDETGRELRHEVKTLRRLSPEELWRATVGVDAPPETKPETHSQGFGGSAEWRLPKLGPGFYRVRVQLADRTDVDFRLEYTFAVLADLPTVRGGPFGWSLVDPAAAQIPQRELPDWLARCGVQWVKYPCWVEPTAHQETENLAWLMGRLADRGIVPVGVLANPPASVLQKLGGTAKDPIAILLRDPEVWQPLLEPIMTRLTSGVRWWQLGDEADFSFLGRSQMTQTIADIRLGLQGFGEPIQVVLSWPWIEPVPADDAWSWQAICLSDPVPQTAHEIRAFFENSGEGIFAPTRPEAWVENPGAEAGVAAPVGLVAEPGTSAGMPDGTAAGQGATPGQRNRPWLTLDPLPFGQYGREERVRDLVMRMIATRAQNIPAAFVSNPFAPELAILRADGTPDELLLPWRTAASLLGDLKPVGSLQLAGNSQNVLMADGQRAVLVLWNAEPTEETLYLGPRAKQLDAYGRTLTVDQVDYRGGVQQRVRVTPEPTFVVDVDRTAALWALGLRLDRRQIDSLVGRNQSIQVQFQNPGVHALSGSFTVDAPDSWNVSSHPRPIAAEPGRVQSVPVSVALRNDATIGREPIAFDFTLDGDSPRRFTVWRHLEVGLEDLHVDVSTRLLDDGRLVVRQELTSAAERTLHFDCYVYARGRIRQRRGTTLAPGATVLQEFYWSDGEELVGDQMLLRLEEHRGERTMNYRFQAAR